MVLNRIDMSSRNDCRSTINDIQLLPFLPRDPRLRPLICASSGESGLHRELSPLQRRVELQLIRLVRTRTHQAHLAPAAH